MARNASDPFDIDDAFRGNTALFPAKHGGFVDAERTRQCFKAQFGALPILPQWVG